MKIAMIGAGNVGASVAFLLLSHKIAKELVLLDINANLAKGKALDLAQSATLLDINAKIQGGDDYKMLKNADICVLTAGFARKDGQSRDELASKNASIVSLWASKIAKFAPKSVIIVVTNPLDVMVSVALKFSGFEKERVLGMAGELDSARLKYEIATHFGLKNSDVSAQMFGEHGQNMFALNASVRGRKISKNELLHLENQAKIGGAKFIALLGTSAFYAPSAGIFKMCKALKSKNGTELICSIGDENGVACAQILKFGKKIKIINAKLNAIKAKKYAQAYAAIKQNLLNLENLSHK